MRITKSLHEAGQLKVFVIPSDEELPSSLLKDFGRTCTARTCALVGHLRPFGSNRLALDASREMNNSYC